jgi:hypothetical protein
VSSTQRKIVAIVAAVVVVGVLLGFYVGGWLMGGPKAYDVTMAPGSKSVNLTLETVAAVGPALAENPDWVSYLVRNEQGRWLHTTIWKVPAHTLVHVTVYQFDGNSGLRNPYMSLVRGTVGGTMQLDGKTMRTIDPDDASHTFAVPQLGLIVPLAGVADDAKNQCDFAPCALSDAHRTITFAFRTPGPGRYRWQCFVPCAAGFLDGFGGPMQTLGYMDGFLNVA